MWKVGKWFLLQNSLECKLGETKTFSLLRSQPSQSWESTSLWYHESDEFVFRMTGPHPFQSFGKTENPHGTVKQAWQQIATARFPLPDMVGIGQTAIHMSFYLPLQGCGPMFQFVHRSPFFSACECEAHTHSDAGLGFFSWRSLLNVEINLRENTKFWGLSTLPEMLRKESDQWGLVGYPAL